jgi:predicted NAD/FAD-binding protein
MSCLRYDINILQDVPISRFGDVLITLNPLSPPHPSFVQGVWEFTEPEPTAESLGAQSRLPSIQNTRGLSYGFCWTGRGLLEDAITSGLRMAVEDLGATIPFNIAFHSEPLASTDYSKQRPGIRVHLIKTVLQAIRLLVVVLEILLLLLRRVHTPASKIRARLSFFRILRSP